MTTRLFAIAVAILLPACLRAEETNTPDGPHGLHATIDLPASQHIRNVGGSDGLGLCVFSSVEVSARWQGVHELDGLQMWMRSRPGGGWPEKLASEITTYCKSKGVKEPRYVQHTGGDPAFLDLAFKTRRAPAITWGANHMLNGMYLDSTNSAMLDNNQPGVWQWTTRAAFLERWQAQAGPAPQPIMPWRPAPAPWRPFRPFRRGAFEPALEPPFLVGAEPIVSGNGGGWAVVLLGDPPPPGTDTAPVPTPKPSPSVQPTPRPCPGPNCPRMPSNGVDSSKIPVGRHYWIGGVEVTAAQAYAALEEDSPPTLVDDSDKPHLTVVVPTAAERTAALTTIAANAGSGLAHVQVYTPTDWPVVSGRCKAGTTMQASAKSGGKVLATRPGTAAEDLDEILKYTDPAYKPAPPTAPAPSPKVDPAPVPDPTPVVPSAPVTPTPVPAAPVIPPATKDDVAPSQSTTTPTTTVYIPSWMLAAGTVLGGMLLRKVGGAV